MRYRAANNWPLMGIVGVLAGLLAWPGIADAQTVTGQASAVHATVLGTTTMLADTGTLSNTSDARDASQLTGSIPSLVTGDVLHATAIGWPDQVASEASLADLGMTVAGTGISADFVMARAFAVLDGSGTGLTTIEGLTIGGVPVFPTGAPNQNVSLGVLSIILNEQVPSVDGMTVNALHVKTVDGLIDVVIGSAKAAITTSSSTSSGTGGILSDSPLSGTTSLF